MLLISLYRIFKFAGQGFWRNFWLSVVTISIIVLTFISINFIVVLNFISGEMIKNVQNKVDVSVYFKAETDENKILEVRNFLTSLSQVKEANYISSAEALEKFRQRHKNDIIILKSLEELEKNPLSAALIVKAKDISNYPEIISILDNSQYSKELTLDKNFEDHKKFINQIDAVSKKINTAGIIVITIFIVIALLIVFNAIRVAIYTHREEITVMKLVGTNNSFIVLPFIIEGVMYAIFACLISLIITYPFLKISQPYLIEFFGGINVNLVKYFNENFLMIFGFELLGIIILNTIASSIAVRKYLKV